MARCGVPWGAARGRGSSPPPPLPVPSPGAAAPGPPLRPWTGLVLKRRTGWWGRAVVLRCRARAGWGWAAAVALRVCVFRTPASALDGPRPQAPDGLGGAGRRGRPQVSRAGGVGVGGGSPAGVRLGRAVVLRSRARAGWGGAPGSAAGVCSSAGRLGGGGRSSSSAGRAGWGGAGAVGRECALERRAGWVGAGGRPQAPDGVGVGGGGALYVWVWASVRAWLRARRAGPRQPQVQWAVQKGPFSTVVVRCSSWSVIAPTVPRRDGDPYRSLTGTTRSP
ncbi:hypothetical protein SVIRM249S_03243 [Streptomyces viridochromogenes]